MGKGTSPQESIWALVDSVRGHDGERTRQTWVKELRRAVGLVDADDLPESFLRQWRRASTSDFYDAYSLYTGCDDADSFADFVIAVMLKGEDEYNRWVSDPEALVELGVPRDAHHEVDDFLWAARSLVKGIGGALDKALAESEELSEEHTRRIEAVDLSIGVRPAMRRSNLVSAKEHQYLLRYAAYTASCVKRWPKLERK